MADLSPASLLTGTPPASKEEFVYETLKEAILSGQLKPGDSLVQTEIAQRLGVSPIPIRAAVNRLIAEGLVTQATYRSPMVSQLSTDRLQEILHIRMHLEVLATGEALPRLTPERLADLTALCREMTEAIEAGEYHRFGALNKAFHLRLYEAGPYPLLVQMIKDLWDNSDRHRSRSMFVLVPGLAERSQQDHLKMLELIREGRTTDLLELTEQHKRRSRETFFRMLAEGQV